jgi:hypothetical protein
VLDDIATDALSGAVLSGIGFIHNSAAGGSAVKGWRRAGVEAIESGDFETEAHALAFTPGVGIGLAALSMRPGGVRVCGIVFCATHYPAGTLARFRLSCPQCSPDDTMHSWPRTDPRDVVSIEGTL